jgi:hypothetical protein
MNDGVDVCGLRLAEEVKAISYIISFKCIYSSFSLTVHRYIIILSICIRVVQ